jgi:hypothetical protein
MLVYIREQDRDEIMREVTIEDIPLQIKGKFDEENKLNQKLEQDQSLLEECGDVFLVTFDIIRSWRETGIMQMQTDIYETLRFSQNDEQRLRLKMPKNQKVIDLLTMIRRKVKIPTNELNLYRIRYY